MNLVNTPCASCRGYVSAGGYCVGCGLDGRVSPPLVGTVAPEAGDRVDGRAQPIDPPAQKGPHP